MEYKTIMEPVQKIYFEVTVLPNAHGQLFTTKRNREVRDWLGANCGCTWETQIVDLLTIGIYFEIGAEKDAATFKMFWIGVEK